MPANWSPTPVRADGDYLTGSAYQADRLQAASADVPQVQDDYSATLVEMQTVADPAPGGTPSLATTLAGELERLRYAIRQTKQALSPSLAQWYDVLPPVTLPTLPVPVSQGGTGATTVAGAQDALMVYSTTEVDALVAALPDLPAGGATNALLAKTSATDYATGWTTTPTLAGATITGSASVGGSLTAAGDMHSATITVDGNASIGGTLTSKHAVRAAGAINGTNGALYYGFGFSTTVRTSVGVYTLTLATALTNPLPIVTGIASPVFAGVSALNSTTVEVRIWNSASAVADASFCIAVVSTA